MTKIYHDRSCAWAEQLEGSDRAVWFGSREEAERAGYTPADDCVGEE
jgi:hypothetical protein